MRTLIIHNPKSGFGSDAVYQFQRSVVRPGDECVFRLLKDDFDPREAVRDATDSDAVVVVDKLTYAGNLIWPPVETAR